MVSSEVSRKDCPRSCSGLAGSDEVGEAIFYATLTNIIAYLPFLLLNGNTGEFPQKPPYRHDNGIALCIGVAMDVCSTAGLLHSASAGQERTYPGGEAATGILWFL